MRLFRSTAVLVGVLMLVTLLPTHDALAQSCDEVRSITDSFRCARQVATNSGLRTGTTAAGIGISIINWALSLVAILAVGAIVWGSIMYITSLGDEQRVGRAKTIILAAIIGLVIAGLSFLIVSTIVGVLGAGGPPAGGP